MPLYAARSGSNHTFLKQCQQSRRKCYPLISAEAAIAKTTRKLINICVEATEKYCSVAESLASFPEEMSNPYCGLPIKDDKISARWCRRHTTLAHFSQISYYLNSSLPCLRKTHLQNRQSTAVAGIRHGDYERRLKTPRSKEQQ